MLFEPDRTVSTRHEPPSKLHHTASPKSSRQKPGSLGVSRSRPSRTLAPIRQGAFPFVHLPEVQLDSTPSFRPRSGTGCLRALAAAQTTHPLGPANTQTSPGFAALREVHEAARFLDRHQSAKLAVRAAAQSIVRG